MLPFNKHRTLYLALQLIRESPVRNFLFGGALLLDEVAVVDNEAGSTSLTCYCNSKCYYDKLSLDVQWSLDAHLKPPEYRNVGVVVDEVGMTSTMAFPI